MASGPAGETSVLLSAGVSLLVFVLYFASILAAVPKHWGVPYKDRLSRYLARSRAGLAVEALNACFSLVRGRRKERVVCCVLAFGRGGLPLEVLRVVALVGEDCQRGRSR